MRRIAIIVLAAASIAAAGAAAASGGTAWAGMPYHGNIASTSWHDGPAAVPGRG